MPIAYIFFASCQTVCPVQAVLRHATAIILTRSSRRSLRQCITSIYFTGTPTKKQLSVHVKRLFTVNRKDSVIPKVGPIMRPRSYNVGKCELRHISSLIGTKLTTKTFPNYRIIIVGSNVPICGHYFNDRSSASGATIHPASLFSLTSLAGAATALLTIVGLCSRKGLGLASGTST